MSEKPFEGWAIKYKWAKKLYPPVFYTRRYLIEHYERGIKNKWRDARRKGTVKAVKVRIVEVNDGQ